MQQQLTGRQWDVLGSYIIKHQEENVGFLHGAGVRPQMFVLGALVTYSLLAGSCLYVEAECSEV